MPVAGAAIRLQSTIHGHNTVRQATTGADGAFSVEAVRGESYAVTVSFPGFRSVGEVVVGGASLKPIHLLIAESSESMDVTDEAGGGRLELQETEGGVTVDRRQLAAVPLNGRSLTDLLAITPGVVPAGSAQPNAVVMSGVASTPPSGELHIGALSVSGQRETANAFRVNNSNVQEDVNMGMAIVPTLDSIAELKVLTNDFDAKLGNQSGGQIQVTTRSGGEHVHGTLYDYFRNTALDARSYFSQERAPFHQNQFGGTLGGPVPHSGWKYFADYQGTRQTQGIDTGAVAVPTQANRNGEFGDSSSLTGTVSGGAWAQTLSGRLGYPVAAGEPYTQVFPNGTIPRSAWSAPAKALLKFIPEPNLGKNTFGSSRYAQTLRDDKGALRLDRNSRAGQLMLYGFTDDYNLLNPYPTAQGGANVPGFSARNEGRAQLYAVNLASTLDSQTVNTAHMSLMRNAAMAGQPVGGQGISLASQGFVTGAGTPGIFAGSPETEGIENIVFNGFTMGTTVTGLSQAENMFELSDDVSRLHGQHVLSFGVGFHVDQINTQPDVYDNGSFSFTGSETGLDFADFLLGIDSSYTQGGGQNFYNRNHYAGLYGQDSWRATHTLTLNYGLRWEVLPPWHEKYNQLLSLDANEQSVVFPNAPKGILFPGDPGVPRTISPTRYTNLAPRIAGAWAPGRLHAHTVLRAGYGLYYSAFEGLSAGIMSGNAPYGVTETLPAPTLFDQPFLEAADGEDLRQRFPLQAVPFGASAVHPVTTVDWANFEPLTGIPAFAKNNVVPRSENYTVAVSQQLGARTTATVSYVGTQAHHLLVIQPVNPGNPALCLALSQPAEVAPGSATCGPFSESSGFTAADGTVYGGTRTAYSGAFGGVNLQKTIANAHNNALEANLQHVGRDLYLQIAYTWSKSIDQSSSLAEAVYPETPLSNAGLSRAVSAFDMRHNLSATYRFAPLERWAPRHPKIAGGWQLSGLTRLGTGLPVTLVNNNDTSLLGTAPNGINNNGLDEPMFTAGSLQLHHRPDAPAFNTALFGLPVLGTLGNARRRFFAGPGIDNTDLALSKATRLREAVGVEVRMEVFNVFNHAEFFGPAAVQGNLSASNFGQIQTVLPPRLMQVSARLSF